MKQLGVILVVLGLIGGGIAYSMPTTVPSRFGEVVNINLIESRRNHLMMAGLTTLVGVILYGFGSVSVRSHATLRPCPVCAEEIQPSAVTCRFCGADVPKVDPAELESKASAKKDPGWDWSCSQCGGGVLVNYGSGTEPICKSCWKSK